jgi:hypothetical protein
MNMQFKHFALLGACLVSIGTMGSSFHDWAELMKPGFVFGALGMIGANITAMYTERPNERP